MSHFFRQVAIGCVKRPVATSLEGFVWLIVVVLGLISSPLAHAHFKLNNNIRIIQIEKRTDSLLLSMRLPAPLAYTEYSTSGNELEKTKPIPYVISTLEKGHLVHYLDKSAIKENNVEFAKFIMEGYRLELDGINLSGEVIDLQVFTSNKQTRFTNREEIKTSFKEEWLFQTNEPQYVGDAVIDIRVRYSTTNTNGEIRFSNVLVSHIPQDKIIANLFISYDGEKQLITRATGQLSEPIVLNPSQFNTIKSFMIHGFEHILYGFDHVLFVLCLTLGTVSLGSLLWRVTGFTLGHTITLIAGFFGYAIQSDWFIPMVELMIAVSIIYVALVAIRKKAGTHTPFFITSFIGLLHGFGFSFLLSDLLGKDSPHLVTSLLSFNIGIEFGQLLIVSLIFVGLICLEYFKPALKNFCSNALAISSMLISGWWILQRSENLINAI